MNSRRFFILVLTVVLLGGAGWLSLRSGSAVAPAKISPIAVTAIRAESRTVPVWLTGLGTVQASQTVTIRPRTSGELTSIHFTEGQLVKAGDLLAEIDPRPAQAALQQALAKKNQADSRLANDRREYERMRGLIVTHSESQQQLDQRTAALAESTAQLQAAQAAVEIAQLQLDFTAIRAPIDGLTGMRLLDAGNLVTANQSSALVVLTQTRPCNVVFTLPQQALAALRQRLNTSVHTPVVVEILSDRGQPLARGQLDLIDNQIDSATGTLRLKATFANDDRSLWPGQFVNARVLVDTLVNAVVVPAEAVQPGRDGPFVYVVKTDSTVAVRGLKLGPIVDNFAVIQEGLQVGETVVREGQNKLQPSARVEATAAPTAPDAAVAAAAR
jgi:membrane fusion protein, multidrug efflux system